LRCVFRYAPLRVICPSCPSAAIRLIDLTPQITGIFPRIPSRKRGVGHRHERWGGMRWTRTKLLTRACACGRRSRVVLTPRRWRQVFAGRLARATVATKPGRRGEHEISRKTIARGMPDVSGVTVVTNACAFYHCTRGCGRAERPAFPAPSFPGRTNDASLGRCPRRENKLR
jgi:hypothetical protein